MVDDLVREIDNEIDTNGTQPHVEDVDESSPERKSEEFGSDEQQGYVIEIQNEGETLATFSDGVQSDVMAQAVNYLVKNYDLISELEPLPYIPGREKAIINNEPSTPHDDEAMRAHRELSSGHYIDTHANKRGKKRTVRTLAEECGLVASFAGQW